MVSYNETGLLRHVLYVLLPVLVLDGGTLRSEEATFPRS